MGCPLPMLFANWSGPTQLVPLFYTLLYTLLERAGLCYLRIKLSVYFVITWAGSPDRFS